MMNISFEAIDNKGTISTLKTEWRNSLTFPHDSFWEAQFESSQHWALKLEEKIIGYACVSERNTLNQFYITPKYLMYGTEILEEFIKQKEIKKGLIGTNNTIFFSLIMQFQKSMEIIGYTFKDMQEVNQEERDAEFRGAKPEELERLVNFHIGVWQASVTSKDWYKNYIGQGISRGEYFVLEKKNEIIGTLEVRTTDLYMKKASLGVSVAQDFRNQGYGSYLLSKGKSISKSRNIEPICSCTKENIASLKAIEKSGFRKLYLILMITLK